MTIENPRPVSILPADDQSACDIVRRINVLDQDGETSWRQNTLPERLQKAADLAVETLHADRVSLIVLDLQGRTVNHFLRAGPGLARIDLTTGFDELLVGLSGWVLTHQEPALSPKGKPDPRESADVQRRRAQTNCGAIIVVPLRHRTTSFGTMTAINRPSQRDFTSIDIELLSIFGNHCATLIENARLLTAVDQSRNAAERALCQAEGFLAESRKLQTELARKARVLEQLAERDALTGLFNRRIVEQRAESVWQHCLTQALPLAVLNVSIDHFDAFNERFGQAAGDGHLKRIAAILEKAARPHTDTAARFDDDQFVVILPDTDRDAACRLAATIGTAIGTAAFAGDISVSIGVAGGLPADLPGVGDLLNKACDAARAATAAGGQQTRIDWPD